MIAGPKLPLPGLVPDASSQEFWKIDNSKDQAIEANSVQ